MWAPPSPRQIRDWRAAEVNAADWMRFWGFADATLTPPGSDSGIDVVAQGALAQVKFEAHHVGRPVLQRLVGAGKRGEGVILLCFTGNGYTQQALAYADEMAIALFSYGPFGEMTPDNGPARTIVERPLRYELPFAGPSPALALPPPSARHGGIRLVITGLVLCAAVVWSSWDPSRFFGDGPSTLSVLFFGGLMLFGGSTMLVMGLRRLGRPT